jgi:acetylglutamate kinase
MKVIKIGGAVIDTPHLRAKVLSMIAQSGEPCVLIHGEE